MHLFGRIHIDRHNAMMWGDYELEGILENARVTALPIQTAARVSPGSGISCMQMITALRQGILVPWRKQQVEQPRPMLDLIHADFGGLVYQPTVGLHRDVGAIDFVSMYPAVMVRCNISARRRSRSRSPIRLPEDPGLIPANAGPAAPETGVAQDSASRNCPPGTRAANRIRRAPRRKNGCWWSVLATWATKMPASG